MPTETPPEWKNWGVWLIDQLIHPFTIVATPGFLLILMIYLVISAFTEGFHLGMRSFAGVLFPLVLVAFIFIFQRDLLERLGKVPTLAAYAFSLVIGLVVMIVLAWSPAVPIKELVLSGSFSLLVFSHVSLRGNAMLAYYYGMISGLLLYTILLGFPTIR